MIGTAASSTRDGPAAPARRRIVTGAGRKAEDGPLGLRATIETEPAAWPVPFTRATTGASAVGARRLRGIGAATPSAA